MKMFVLKDLLLAFAESCRGLFYPVVDFGVKTGIVGGGLDLHWPITAVLVMLTDKPSLL